jgi:hypothetical protein
MIRGEARAVAAGLDPTAITAAFAQPDNDGSFAGAFGDYLAELGSRRPALIFAFPPKAAGTFLRTAAIVAVDGQLIRIVHAQGGRDAQPYLPLLISYYAGGMGEKTLVTHVHMQALQANRRLLEAFDLKPVTMLRSIPDMLASYWDMLETDDTALADGLNCHFPANFRSLPHGQKAELLVDVLAPWYVGYYATWIAYAEESPRRVCVLDYDDFLQAPDITLETALMHARLPRTRAICRAAIDEVWQEKDQFRFNRGEAARGGDYFSAQQIARIRRMLSHYPVPDRVAERLVA